MRRWKRSKRILSELKYLEFPKAQIFPFRPSRSKLSPFFENYPVCKNKLSSNCSKKSAMFSTPALVEHIPCADGGRLGKRNNVLIVSSVKGRGKKKNAFSPSEKHSPRARLKIYEPCFGRVSVYQKSKENFSAKIFFIWAPCFFPSPDSYRAALSSSTKPFHGQFYVPIFSLSRYRGQLKFPLSNARCNCPRIITFGVEKIIGVCVCVCAHAWD